MAIKRPALVVLFAATALLVSATIFDQIRYGIRGAKIGCYLPQDAVDFDDRTVVLYQCCPWEEHEPDYYQDEPASPSGVTAVYEQIYEYYWGICMNCFNELREVCDDNGCSMQRVCASSLPMAQGELVDGTPLPEPPGALPAGAIAVALLELARRRVRRSRIANPE